jgi:hypothetical protein
VRPQRDLEMPRSPAYAYGAVFGKTTVVNSTKYG